MLDLKLVKLKKGDFALVCCWKPKTRSSFWVFITPKIQFRLFVRGITTRLLCYREWTLALPTFSTKRKLLNLSSLIPTANDASIVYFKYCEPKTDSFLFGAAHHNLTIVIDHCEQRGIVDVSNTQEETDESIATKKQDIIPNQEIHVKLDPDDNTENLTNSINGDHGIVANKQESVLVKHEGQGWRSAPVRATRKRSTKLYGYDEAESSGKDHIIPRLTKRRLSYSQIREHKNDPTVQLYSDLFGGQSLRKALRSPKSRGRQVNGAQ